MATRYFVKTGNWSSTATWSATSGGSGGASVPTSSDDVILNSAKTGTLTITGTSNCKSLTCTGFTGTMAGSSSYSFNCYGNFTLATTMTYTMATKIYFKASSGTTLITTNGKTLARVFFDTAATFSLQDDLLSNAAIVHTRGTFTTNDHAVTCTTFTSSNTNSRTINLGASTVTLTGTGTVWGITTATNLTLNAGTSTIVLSNVSTTTKTFTGGGKTYYDLNITGGGSGTVTFQGSNTWHTITCGYPKTIIFTSGTTQTCYSINWVGATSNLITSRSTVSGSKWNLVVTGYNEPSPESLIVTDAGAEGANGTYTYSGGGYQNENGWWVFYDSDVWCMGPNASRPVCYESDGSTLPGNPWHETPPPWPNGIVNVTPLPTVTVQAGADGGSASSASYCSVKDCNATGAGAPIDNTVGGSDAGNNVGWLFPDALGDEDFLIFFR